MSGPAEQRRRSLRVAAALLGVAAIGIAVGVYVAVSGGDDRSNTDPTPPTTSQTSPSTTAPSATDGETDPATGPTTIPADLRLTHEGEPADGDFSAWDEVDWTYQPCSNRRDTYPAIERAGQVRHLRRTGPVYDASETLVVLRTTSDAEALMLELRAAGAPCPADGADAPSRSTITRVDGDWGDGIVLAVEYEYPDSPGSTAASAYLMAVRHGRAVVMTTVAGEYVAPLQGDQPDPAVVEELRATPDAMASQLCIYTEAGC